MKLRGYSGVLITTSSLREFASNAHKNTTCSHEGFHVKYSGQITVRTTQEKEGEGGKEVYKLLGCFNDGTKKVNGEGGGAASCSVKT